MNNLYPFNSIVVAKSQESLEEVAELGQDF